MLPVNTSYCGLCLFAPKMIFCRENGRFLPASSYKSRKQLYNDEENGYFTEGKERPAVVQNPMSGV